jgi:uncharacterized membrane protein YqaE (UPF0057 family)
VRRITVYLGLVNRVLAFLILLAIAAPTLGVYLRTGKNRDD